MYLSSEKRLGSVMEMNKIEPKILMKKGFEYFEAKVSSQDLEYMLNGNDKFGKYQLPTVMDKVDTWNDFGIPINKLYKYGSPLPVRESIMAPEGVVERKNLIIAIQKFFDSALSFAQIYRGDYVELDKMQIYELSRGEVVVYEINGLAQLLRKT
jgi:hypothetical protein